MPQIRATQAAAGRKGEQGVARGTYQPPTHTLTTISIITLMPILRRAA